MLATVCAMRISDDARGWFMAQLAQQPEEGFEHTLLAAAVDIAGTPRPWSLSPPTGAATRRGEQGKGLETKAAEQEQQAEDEEEEEGS